MLTGRLRLDRASLRACTVSRIGGQGRAYSGAVATNIGRMHGVGGSHQPQWLDALHRAHAVVEDRVCTGKAMGLHNLPSSSWQINKDGCSLRASRPTWTPGPCGCRQSCHPV